MRETSNEATSSIDLRGTGPVRILLVEGQRGRDCCAVGLGTGRQAGGAGHWEPRNKDQAGRQPSRSHFNNTENECPEKPKLIVQSATLVLWADHLLPGKQGSGGN